MDVRIAIASGMTLREIDAAPQPDIEIWELFLANEPVGSDKTELYLARLTMIVAGLFSKRKLHMKDFKVDWKHSLDAPAAASEALFGRITDMFRSIAKGR